MHEWGEGWEDSGKVPRRRLCCQRKVLSPDEQAPGLVNFTPSLAFLLHLLLPYLPLPVSRSIEMARTLK